MELLLVILSVSFSRVNTLGGHGISWHKRAIPVFHLVTILSHNRPMLIDSHCHLDAPDFNADRIEVLVRCREMGVTTFVIPGVSAQGWDALLAFASAEQGVHPALGLHPVYLANHRSQDLIRLAALLAARTEIVAVGEIGLDYFIVDLARSRQHELFCAQLVIAQAANRPVLLHVRKAHDEVLAALRRHKVCGGIVHAFNGSMQQAMQYIELGFVLGFGGALTYERAHKLHRLARELPLESIVLETDAPDMVPSLHRGERNSPEYLPEILAVLARIRDESPEQLAGQTTRNVRRVLRLPGDE